MILFKTNGKEVFVLSDLMFRVNVMKRGKWCIFGVFCFSRRHMRLCRQTLTLQKVDTMSIHFMCYSIHLSTFVFRIMASFMIALVRTMYNNLVITYLITISFFLSTHVTFNNIYQCNLI